MDLGRAQQILDTAHNAFVSMDQDGMIAYWNPRAEEMFGFSREEAIGRPLAETIIPARFREAHWRGLEKFLKDGDGPVLNRRVELSALRRNGTEFPIEITISALADPDDGLSFHAFVQDISERKASEQERAELLARVEAMARTDELTGLANRRSWDEELPRELARAQRQRYGVTVILLDLDHFKDYNDRFGHPAGDELLKEVAATWRLTVRVTDLVARHGGEEFAVLLPQCPPRSAADITERLRQAMPSQQTLSGGIAVWDGQETPETLVARADAALYTAKRQGRNQWVQAAPP